MGFLLYEHLEHVFVDSPSFALRQAMRSGFTQLGRRDVALKLEWALNPSDKGALQTWNLRLPVFLIFPCRSRDVQWLGL